MANNHLSFSFRGIAKQHLSVESLHSMDATSLWIVGELYSTNTTFLAAADKSLTTVATYHRRQARLPNQLANRQTVKAVCHSVNTKQQKYRATCHLSMATSHLSCIQLHFGNVVFLRSSARQLFGNDNVLATCGQQHFGKVYVLTSSALQYFRKVNVPTSCGQQHFGKVIVPTSCVQQHFGKVISLRSNALQHFGRVVGQKAAMNSHQTQAYLFQPNT